MMLIDLPPLEETVAGKELIQTAEARGEKRGEARGEARGEIRGEARGEARGLCEAVLLVCKARFQRVPDTLSKQILLLQKSTAQALLSEVINLNSVAAVKEWLSKHADRKRMNGSARRKS